MDYICGKYGVYNTRNKSAKNSASESLSISNKKHIFTIITNS